MISTNPKHQTRPGHNQPLTFGRDHRLRRRLFTEASFQHKARVNLYWLRWLLDQHISGITTILDPMGGVECAGHHLPVGRRQPTSTHAIPPSHHHQSPLLRPVQQLEPQVRHCLRRQS
jgi:hypothetical protein